MGVREPVRRCCPYSTGWACEGLCGSAALDFAVADKEKPGMCSDIAHYCQEYYGHPCAPHTVHRSRSHVATRCSRGRRGVLSSPYCVNRMCPCSSSHALLWCRRSRSTCGVDGVRKEQRCSIPSDFWDGSSRWRVAPRCLLRAV